MRYIMVQRISMHLLIILSIVTSGITAFATGQNQIPGTWSLTKSWCVSGTNPNPYGGGWNDVNVVCGNFYFLSDVTVIERCGQDPASAPSLLCLPSELQDFTWTLQSGNCNSSPDPCCGKPNCCQDNDQTQSCTMADGCTGQQVCTNGQWSSCQMKVACCPTGAGVPDSGGH
jgi:hypothetical protein